MINYIAQAKKNPQTKTLSYYAQVAPVTPLKLDDIVRRIEKTCTVSSADIKAVLDALQHEIVESLRAGNSVRLGDLGSFRATLSSSGVETPEKVSAALIKSVRVRFTPGAKMNEIFGNLKALSFNRVEGVIKDETVTE